jgi:hypothetical protein
MCLAQMSCQMGFVTAFKATGGEVIVNPGRTATLAEQGPLERARWD